jgi:hypothetical protein
VIAVQEESGDGIPPGPPHASGAPTTPGSAPGSAEPGPAGGATAEPGPLAFSTRRRAYFALMGACLLLIVLSWTLIWRFSILAAVIMSAVALFIPPLAAIVANSGQANRQLRHGRVRRAGRVPLPQHDLHHRRVRHAGRPVRGRGFDSIDLPSPDCWSAGTKERVHRRQPPRLGRRRRLRGRRDRRRDRVDQRPGPPGRPGGPAICWWPSRKKG